MIVSGFPIPVAPLGCIMKKIKRSQYVYISPPFGPKASSSLLLIIVVTLGAVRLPVSLLVDEYYQIPIRLNSRPPK